MPSPFPGMDPYIEAHRIWLDFHNGLATEVRAQLNTQIQPHYYATTIPYVAYDTVAETQSPPSHLRLLSPNGSLWRSNKPSGKDERLTVLEPPATPVFDPPSAQSIMLMEVELRLANVVVREAATDTVITSIEILSPVNKRAGAERQRYLIKRQRLLRSLVHVMEIDLLRGGQRTPLGTPVPAAPYYVTLSREESRTAVDVWAIPLEERLPVVPVPLKAPDADVPLNLGAVVRSVYERGAYATRLDYREAVPPPPLTPGQQAWVDELLKQ